MNNKIKGAISAAAAGVLLLGGLGSLAYWNDSESAGGGTLASGELSLDTPTAVAWFDVTGGVTEPIASITDFRIVPGDVLEYRASAGINADGDNLKATVTADGSAITGEATALSPFITTAVAAKIGTTPVTTITEANNNQVIDLVVTVTFSNTATGLQGQNSSVNLSDLKVTLQQVQQ